MSLMIILSVVAALVLAICVTSFFSSKCPHCQRYALRHAGTKIVERVPMILSQNHSGVITLRGEKIVKHTTLHCKHCNEDVVYVTENVG